MADPTKYVPGFSYSDWQAVNPKKPLPGDEVDNDLANLQRTTNETIDGLKDVRRSDGKLKNQSVGPDQLSAALTIGFTFTGTWVDGDTYSAGDGVVYGTTFYSARVTHTADVANAPGNDGYWNELFSLDDIVVTGGMSLPRSSFTGDGATTEFTLSFTPLSKFNVFVQIGGVIQATDQYSTNGSTLTFVDPPGNGYAIEVRGFATTAAMVTPEDGSVTTEKLADLAVTEDKLAAPVSSKLNSALQPEDIGVAVQAHSANLDELAWVPPGEAGKSVLASETEGDIRDFLDILKGFAANGVTDDTAKFATLEADFQNRKVDLRRSTYLVSAIPTGNVYENGWFGATRTPPGGVGSPILIRTPARNTLLADTMKLTTGHRYACWPEHKWHVYNGVIYALWNEGYAHNSSDLHVRVARSYDGGQTWTKYERHFQTTAGQQTCWAAGVLDGQQYVIIREIFSGTTNFRLYSRRLYEKRAVTCNVTTTNGSNVIELALPTHGTKVGQTVEFDETFVVNGVTVTGGTAYAAAANTSDLTLKLTIAGSANATSSGTVPQTFDIQFIETGFSQVTFGGVSFGEAVIAKGVLLAQPAEYTGLEPVSGQGIFYTGIASGNAAVAPGTVGEIVVKATGLFSTPTISKTVATTTADRGDTTVRRLSTGNLMGLSRTNNSASMKMWFSDDDLGTFTVHINGPGTTFVQSSVPFVVIDDTWVVASLTGNRFGDPESATASARNPVPVYLAVGLYSELKAEGWTAFKYYKVGYVFHENRFADNEAPGCGVGSIALFGDTLVLGNATENYDDQGKAWNNTNGNPDIYSTRLKLGDFISDFRTSAQEVIGQNALALSRGTAMQSESAYVEEVFGSSTIYCQAMVKSSDGTLYSKRRVTLNKTGTGVSVLTYDKLLPANRIFPHVTSLNTNGIANVASVNGTSCTVHTKSFAGVLTDYDFAFSLSYLNDFAREEWSY
jgi:hypothetical protein